MKYLGILTFVIVFCNVTIPAQQKIIQNDSLIITEIMFYPQSGNNEFIELYNLSTTSYFDLENYHIRYYSSLPDSIIDSGNGTILPPNSYAVILEGDYDIENGIYKNIIPPSALLLRISSSAFGTNGMANTTSRPVWLISSEKDTIDCYYYSADNASSYSDEKMVLSWDTASVNWGNSITQNGTPGYINSIIPRKKDISIEEFSADKKYGIPGEEIGFNVNVKNRGCEIIAGINIGLYSNPEHDFLIRSENEISTFLINELLPGESCKLNFSYTGITEGINYFIAKIHLTDEDTSNNIKFYDLEGIKVNVFRSDILINEIMYAPEDEPEWIEIYNNSSSEINMRKFSIADRIDTLLLTKNDFILSPGRFAVISSDSTLLQVRNIPSDYLFAQVPALNNTGDKLVLLDSLSRVIDSLEYYTIWGGTNGYSLERVNHTSSSYDSLNWKQSGNRYKATPGYLNSVSAKMYDVSVEQIKFIPAYPVKGDSAEIIVILKNNGTESAEVKLNIFSGNKLIPVTSVAANILSGSASEIFTDYKTCNSGKITAEVSLQNDHDTSNNHLTRDIVFGYARGSIIINEVHFNPPNGECEWIELYNCSEDTVKIKDWMIRDVLTVPFSEALKQNYLFLPKSFLLVSTDSSVIKSHYVIPSDVVIINLPNLNNDKDGIVISDYRGATIDSMLYEKQAVAHTSLERISEGSGSDLSQNWEFSRDRELSTPGRINSVSPKKYDLAVASIDISPRFPVLNDSVQITVSVSNYGLEAAEGFDVKIFTQDVLLGALNVNQLGPGETENAVCPVLLSLEHPVLIKVFIDFNQDEDQYNNMAEKLIEPGEKAGRLIISEIMCDPFNSPEWVEIYNPSEVSINLQNWSISDILPAPSKDIIKANNFYIEPGDYVVISQDSSILIQYPSLNKFLISEFGSLSSTEDGVILYDFRGAIIDSVRYSSRWGIKKGISLERKSYEMSSSDPSNWNSSLSYDHATPGAKNSVTDIPSGASSSVVINEIMYDPGIDNCEFIELYNRSTSELNLGGWRIIFGGDEYLILSDSNYLLQPESYLVFAADSLIIQKYGHLDDLIIAGKSSLYLNNSGNSISLKDINGITIDSVLYLEKFHNDKFLNTKNLSLERINSAMKGNDGFNWTTSVSPEGATPGAVNSVNTVGVQSSSVISISPNPFSPDDDGWEDFAVINYSFNMEAPDVKIKIFDSNGRLVRNLADIPSGSTGSIIYDGHDDQGRALRLGIYILYIEAAGLNEIETYKSAFVIARKL